MTTLMSSFHNYFLASISFVFFAHAEEPTALVQHCSDGDTCTILIESPRFRLWTRARLFGIDAPEVSHRKKSGQPLGDVARDRLNEKIKGKIVQIEQTDLDPFNRPVIEIHYQKENINLWLVSEGLAEKYRGKTKRLDTQAYTEAEQLARSQKKGIWAQTAYQSPKNFRRLQKVK